MKPILLFATLSISVHLTAQSLPEVSLSPATIDAMGIRSAAIEVRQVVDPLHAPGEIILDPSRTRSIATFFPGQVEANLVQPGDRVEAGQQLARLKSREVANAISRWIEAESKLESATLLYERERDLRPRQLTTEDDFLAAKSAYQEALATRTGTFQSARLARSHEDLLRLQRDQGLQDLTTLPINSPLKGTVVRKSADSGDAVEANQELFTVSDLNHLLIEVRAPLKTISYLHPGDQVQFHTIAGPQKEASAEITRINPVADHESLVVRLFAKLPNADRDWLAGTPVSVHLFDQGIPKIKAVPSPAIVTIEGRNHLFLALPENRFKPVAVRTGQSSQALTEITSDFPDESRVVVSGASLLLAAWEEQTGN